MSNASGTSQDLSLVESPVHMRGSGPFGAQTLLYRDGDTAPGTGGALFAQAFSRPTIAFEGMNRNGVIFTRATLVTGTGVPAVTTVAGFNNQQEVWIGMPGDLTLIARKSDPTQGPAGEVAIDNSNSLSFHMEMNESNQVLFDITLSQTQGAPLATAANDRPLMVHTPGLGNQVLVRESDPAPGAGGGTFNSISVTDNRGASLHPRVAEAEARHVCAPGSSGYDTRNSKPREATRGRAAHKGNASLSFERAPADDSASVAIVQGGKTSGGY